MKKTDLTFSWDFVSLVGWRYALAIPMAVGIFLLFFWLINFETVEERSTAKVFDSKVLLLSESGLGHLATFNYDRSLRESLEEKSISKLNQLIVTEEGKSFQIDKDYAQFTEVPIPNFTQTEGVRKMSYDPYFKSVSIEVESSSERNTQKKELQFFLKGASDFAYSIMPGEPTEEELTSWSLPLSLVLSVNEIGVIEEVLPVSNKPIQEEVRNWVKQIRFIENQNKFITLTISQK